MTAHAVRATTGVDVRFAGTMAFPGQGRSPTSTSASTCRPARVLEVAGPDGSLVLHQPWVIREPAIELHRGGAVERIAVPAADSYQLELENLSAAVRAVGRPSSAVAMGSPRHGRSTRSYAPRGTGRRRQALSVCKTRRAGNPGP